MNALLWLDETSKSKINLFEYFRLALFNLFDDNLHIISHLDQVNEINNLIIIDEHFESHKNIIFQDGVISKLNKQNCNVIVFNFEKIFNSHFKLNQVNQKKLKKINKLTHILSDVEDIKKAGSPFINKQLISKEYQINFDLPQKKNEILFLGQIKGSAYKKRRQTLDQLSQIFHLPFTIKFPNRKLNFEDFLYELAKYKFVLNPLGAGQFVNVRYYESLLVNSIPIQQLTSKMPSYYDELTKSFSVNFSKIDETLNFQLNNFEFKNFNYYLEDYLYEVNFASILRK